jgi:hypothetical protein
MINYYNHAHHQNGPILFSLLQPLITRDLFELIGASISLPTHLSILPEDLFLCLLFMCFFCPFLFMHSITLDKEYSLL